MKSNLTFIYSLLIWAMVPALAEPTDFSKELWQQIYRISNAEFESKQKQFGKPLAEYKDWGSPWATLAEQFQTRIYDPSIQIKIFVVSEKTANAYSYPSGQIVLTTGLLDLVSDSGLESEDRLEVLKAAIAHEIGHITQKHVFRTALDRIQDPKKETTIAQLQTAEVEADLVALKLLDEIWFSSKGFQKLMQLLNSERQKQLQSGKSFNPYFDSHPSPHKRLTEVGLGVEDWDALASKLELLYADVQAGNNLEAQIKYIQELMKQFPTNIEFKKLYAVALHKNWEESANVEELQFRSWVYLPSFRDSMLFQGEPKKSALKKIPGDKAKFFKAVLAYRNLPSEFMEPWVLSNYGVLLCYSEKADDEEEAVSVAEEANSLQPTQQTKNNLAVAMFITKSTQKDKAIALWESIPKEQASEIILQNLSLSTSKKAPSIARFLIENNAVRSPWNELVAKSHSLEFAPKEIGKPIQLEGISLGSNLKDVLGLWGKPERAPKVLHLMDVWYFEKKQCKVSFKNGLVVQLDLYGPKSPVVEKVKVGSKMGELEALLGKPDKSVGDYKIYTKGQSIAFRTYRQLIEEITIYP